MSEPVDNAPPRRVVLTTGTTNDTALPRLVVPADVGDAVVNDGAPARRMVVLSGYTGEVNPAMPLRVLEQDSAYTGDIDAADPIRVVYTGPRGLFAELEPAWELAVWRFDGAAVAEPNYGSATLSNTFYRQAPANGLSLNLVEDGACSGTGSKWTLGAAGSYSTEQSSPTGAAVKISTASIYQEQTQILNVEPGRVYSFAAYVRSDGTNYAIFGFRWRDASGTSIFSTNIATSTSASWAEYKSENQTAPGNARTVQVYLSNDNTPGGGAMTCYFSAVRVVQAATVPSWSYSMQNTRVQKGLAVYEGTTNIAGTDADMETAGVANYTPVNCTVAKDATTKFAGTQSLKVTNTSANGYAVKSLAGLISGGTYSVSVRAKVAGTGGNLTVYSVPGNAVVGTVPLGAATDWQTLVVSGALTAGETAMNIVLQSGPGLTDVAYFDNLGVENNDHNTLNSGDGQEYTTGTRNAAAASAAVPTGFNGDSGAAVVICRLDHAYNIGATRALFNITADSNNSIRVFVDGAGNLTYAHNGSGTAKSPHDSAATAPAAGDTLAVGMTWGPSGLKMLVSKNGGVVSTYSLGGALGAFVGTPTIQFGRDGGGVQHLDGTLSILRILKPRYDVDAYITKLLTTI